MIQPGPSILAVAEPLMSFGPSPRPAEGKEGLLFLTQTFGVGHEKRLSFPVEPELFVFSRAIDAVEELVDDPGVVTVGEEGDPGCSKSLGSHLQPGLAEGVHFTVVGKRVGDIEGNKVDAGITELGRVSSENKGVA